MIFSDLLAGADSAVLDSLPGSESVEYRTSYGARKTISAIFDAAHQPILMGEMQISASAPAVFVRLSDLLSNPRDDDGCSFIIDGRHYTPRDVKRDGQGMALVTLEQRETDEEA